MNSDSLPILSAWWYGLVGMECHEPCGTCCTPTSTGSSLHHVRINVFKFAYFWTRCEGTLIYKGFHTNKIYSTEISSRINTSPSKPAARLTHTLLAFHTSLAEWPFRTRLITSRFHIRRTISVPPTPRQSQEVKHWPCAKGARCWECWQ